MAKFDAGLAVETLEYDFTKFGGGAGEIPEPSTKTVSAFFEEMRSNLREAQKARASVESLQVDLEEMDDKEVAGALEHMDETMAQASGYQTKTIEAVAILCGAERLPNPEWTEDGDEPEYVVSGGSPTKDDLDLLPYRVLAEFNKWLIGEIAPKSEREEMAAARQPQDRRAGSSRRRRK